MARAKTIAPQMLEYFLCFGCTRRYVNPTPIIRIKLIIVPTEGIPGFTDCSADDGSSVTNKLETPVLVPANVETNNVPMKNRIIISGPKIIILAGSEFLFLDSFNNNNTNPLARNETAVLNFIVTQLGFSLFRTSSSMNQPINTTNAIMMTVAERILVILMQYVKTKIH